MIKLADIPNVKNYLNRDMYTQPYTDKIMEIINAACYYLVNETLFAKQVACELNNEMLLRDVFDEYIDNFILNYADGDDMEMYNVMTDGKGTIVETFSFWNIWRNDLFDYMLRTYR